MSIIIEESNMKFGPYSENDVFHIETCQLYRQIQQGVKIGEFVLHRLSKANQPALWIAEAKSSSPHPENDKKFATFIEEIAEKMNNTLSLLFALMLHRHPEHEEQLPASCTATDIPSCSVRFVLVIPQHPTASLDPIKLALNKALNTTINIWNFGPNAVVVLNKELAARHALIKD
jgi:hypothetical protein